MDRNRAEAFLADLSRLAIKHRISLLGSQEDGICMLDIDDRYSRSGRYEVSEWNEEVIVWQEGPDAPATPKFREFGSVLVNDGTSRRHLVIPEDDIVHVHDRQDSPEGEIDKEITLRSGQVLKVYRDDRVGLIAHHDRLDRWLNTEEEIAANPRFQMPTREASR